MKKSAFPIKISLCALFFVLFCFANYIKAQCDPVFPKAYSARIANYDIDLTLDHHAKLVTATERLTWTNTSPDTLYAVRLYMYMNAFKNTESTYLKGASNIFGQDFSERPEHEWGWISVDKVQRIGGTNLTNKMRYIHPDDGNKDDQSILEIGLNAPLLPGQKLVLDMDFQVKMPKTISRSGYSKNDFFHFVHWFPQMCVYEVKNDGTWGWNSHQFHRRTEFFSNFGNYDVKITTSKHLVIGASGCLLEKRFPTDSTVMHRYMVKDVIDFAWSAYPLFLEKNDTWEHVNIRVLYPKEHSFIVPRYLAALKHAFSYMNTHVGRYPYPTLTLMDPPIHGLRSGFMEYPTLITAGTFYNMPKGFHGSAALAVHEFVHQYFMGMIATNEKEEAWMDEGFVTYFEDRIVDDMFGVKSGVVDIGGYSYGSRELSRVEYTGMTNPRVGPPARPGWEITEGFKELIYSKTATTLHTVEALIGDAAMDSLMHSYFRKWSFKHPKEKDFFNVLHEVVAREKSVLMADYITALARESITGTSVCDYSVARITNTVMHEAAGIFDTEAGKTYQKNTKKEDILARVTLHRLGDMLVEQSVRIWFDDGSFVDEEWSGQEGSKSFDYIGTKKIVKAHIDPDHQIWLDVDLNNNSLTLTTDARPLWKYLAKVLFWVQNLMQSVGFLM